MRQGFGGLVFTRQEQIQSALLPSPSLHDHLCNEKSLFAFFCKHYGRNRSQWGHCTHQQPLNALTSLHLPSWELHLRPDPNRAPSLLCPADLTDHCALTWGLDSRLNLVPVTASLCSPAVWGLLLRMLPVPGWMEPSCSSSLVWSLWP